MSSIRSIFWTAIVSICSLANPAQGEKNDEKSSDKTLTLYHYQADPRYAFGHMTLELALRSLGFDVQLNPVKDAANINEARGSLMLKLDRGIDYQFLSLNAERARDFIAIDEFPIYQGLLGMRLLLVKKGNRDRFKDVKTIDDLKKFKAIHNEHWSDIAVFHTNGLPVEADTSYDALFRQLISGRGDYFSRGVSEIWGELDLHQEQIEIADHISLFYLHPCVFLLNKKNTGLANLIRKGLRKTKLDGSQDKLFLSYYDQIIKKSRLNTRTMIILKNPSNVGSPIQTIDTSLWMPKESAEAVRKAEL